MQSHELSEEDREMRRIEGRKYAQARRENLKLGQAELARMLGLMPSAIKRRENGRSQIKRVSWLALCGINQLAAFDSLDVMLSQIMSKSLDPSGLFAANKRGNSDQHQLALPPKVSRVMRKMREQVNMSRKLWADSLGVHMQTVQNIESEKHGVTREVFFACVSLFMEAKFQRIELQRITHRYPTHLQEDERI